MADSFLETELADLERSLRLLAANGSVSLSSLSSTPHLQSAVDSVRLGVSLLYDTDSYSLIRQMINRLPQPSTIAPDTIASFLFGCEKVANQPNGFCSPYCIDTVLPPKSMRPIMCCPHQVYILKDNGSLRRLNDIQSSSAQVYTTSSTTLTPEQISTLRNNGVTTAEILLMSPTTPSFKTVSPMKSLVDYQNSSTNTPTKTSSTTRQSNSGSSSLWVWLLLLIFIILIVALVVIFWPR